MWNPTTALCALLTVATISPARPCPSFAGGLSEAALDMAGRLTEQCELIVEGFVLDLAPTSAPGRYLSCRWGTDLLILSSTVLYGESPGDTIRAFTPLLPDSLQDHRVLPITGCAYTRGERFIISQGSNGLFGLRRVPACGILPGAAELVLCSIHSDFRSRSVGEVWQRRANPAPLESFSYDELVDAILSVSAYETHLKSSTSGGAGR
jgi:hypothetical protein